MSYNKITKEIVNKLESIVGKEYVSDKIPMRYAYVSKGIMGLESLPAEAIVRPKNREEIRETLILANENKIPVTPVAGGLSGGFASPLIEPSGILLDLSRMDQILEIDTDARYMVVEPGVRSGTVWAYFRKHYPDWAPPVPDGAPPAATVMGDALERGFSMVTGRYGPQADMILGTEVVVPTGEILYTGSWALPGAKPFYKWGLGPDIGGLFLGAQGTMGVVTKAAVKIVPHPHYKTVVAYGMDNPYDMQDATLEVSKYEMGIADHLVMVQGGNYPLVMCRWPEDRVPTDYEFYKQIGISEWWMNFEIWAHSQEEMDFVTKRIDEIMRDYEAKTGRSLPQWKLHPKQIASRLKKPNKIAIPYSLWNAGFLFITWYTPWKDCAEFSEIYNEKMVEYGFPPVMWIASIDHCRQAICMPIVCYDASKPGDTDRVQDLNRETTEILVEKGWLEYRPDPYVHAPIMYGKAKTYHEILKKIRAIWDPNYIMHPGRLAIP